MQLNVWRAAVWAVLAMGLAITPGYSAGAPPKTNSGHTSTPAANANTNEVLTGLHQAKTLLETAIHDYDGHRAKAVEELHHAIHELTPHNHNNNNSGNKGHKTGANVAGAAKGNAANAAKGNAAGGAKQTTTPGETQAQSDAQLKQALQLISGLSGQIPNTHPKAETHLKNAVGELNAALKIK